MAYQCWTCGVYNDSKKSLKNHAATDHRHLAVICMYCYPKEKTLGRINDLKKHVQVKHASLNQGTESTFYTEGNGFYLSLNPYDYVRHIKPSPMDSEGAKKAMMAVRLLVPALERPSRTLPQWENGWLQAIGTPVRDDVPTLAGAAPRQLLQSKFATMSPTFATAPITPLESPNSMSDYASLPVSLESKDETYYATKVQGVCVNHKETVSKYSPSHPEMTIPNSDIFHLKKEENEVMFKSEGESYKAKLEVIPTKYYNVCNVNASLYTDMHCKKFLGREYYELSESLSKILDVNMTDIGEIRQISELTIKAVESLTTGNMPLFPPAPRDWNKVDQPVKLTNPTTGRTIRWPPVGWKEHTAARKCLNFMAVCFKLDEGDDELPTSQEDLFDKYNFLLLNGSNPVQQNSESAKRRFLNFNVIRNFIKNKKDADLVSMLLSSKGNSSLQLLSQIQNVPLRI